MTLKFNEQGLIPAIAQDRFDGQVRMVAWMNQEALEQTLATGNATFEIEPPFWRRSSPAGAPFSPLMRSSLGPALGPWERTKPSRCSSSRWWKQSVQG